MPYQTPCPECRTVGYVRMERILKGGQSSVSYYCGRCDHEWHVAETAAPPPATRKKKAAPPPKRSRKLS